MAAKKPAGTAVANYSEELARLAGAAATLTDSGGGRFFSTRAGQLSFDDSPLPGNQMVVVVVVWCLENLFYKEAFDPDNRAPPTCFAFCKEPDQKDAMGPNPPDLADPAFEQQSDLCKECPQNEWGSAAKGKGKACGNRRRLACIMGGTYKPLGRGGGYDLELIQEPEHFRSTEEAFLKVPVTSGKAFDNYVREIAEQFNAPLFAVYTRIWLEPDPKSQFKVNFELIEPVPEELIPTLYERYQKLHANIDFPYVPFENDDEPQQQRSASANKKLAGKGKTAARGKR